MKAETMLDLIGTIDEEMVWEAETTPERKRPGKWKRSAIAAAAILVLSLSLPVLASRTDTGCQLLYRISPALCQSLQPVKKSCVSNGIRMDVTGQNIEGSSADIYISLHDEEGRGRVDESTDLEDYAVNAPSDAISGTVSFMQYDKTQQTAYFLIHMETLDGSSWGKWDKVTFSLSGILSGRKEYHSLIEGVSGKDISENPDTETLTPRGASGKSKALPEGEVRVLKPGTPREICPDVTFTGAGIIDGKIHLQFHCADIREKDTHGRLFLYKDKEKTPAESTVSFWDEDGTGSWEEYIFDADASHPEEYQIWGDFWYGAVMTEGSWKVTFALEE